MSKVTRRNLILCLCAALMLPAALGSAGNGAAEPLATYLKLIEDWKRGDIEAILEVMHDDIVWHFSAGGAAPVRGKAQAREWMENYGGQIQSSNWRVVHHAVVGDRLFIEGMEDYVTNEGMHVLLPYAGVYEFKDGKIIAWRDYFSRILSNNLRAGKPIPDYVRELAGG